MSKSLEVLKLLTKIPKGKITTYGALAVATGSSPRAVGQIMRRNAHPEIYPCYKVVSSSGKIHGYAGCMKGAKIAEKKGMLEKDGIVVKNGRIDLKKHMHRF